MLDCLAVPCDENCGHCPKEPWGSNEEILSCCPIPEGLEGDELEAALIKARTIATEILFMRSGARFGFRLDRFMPCRLGCYSCRCDPCSCCVYNKLKLPFDNACNITKVVVGCVEQDLCNYRVDKINGQAWAVALHDDWPTEQCYTDGFCLEEDGLQITATGVGTVITGPNTGDEVINIGDEEGDEGGGVDEDDVCEVPVTGQGWWIEYVYGCPVPALGHLAANDLACKFLDKCSVIEGKCVLPRGVTQINRQGVSMSLDDEDVSYGSALAAEFISVYNPNGLQQRPRVLHKHKTCGREFIRPGLC